MPFAEYWMQGGAGSLSGQHEKRVAPLELLPQSSGCLFFSEAKLPVFFAASYPTPSSAPSVSPQNEYAWSGDERAADCRLVVLWLADEPRLQPSAPD